MISLFCEIVASGPDFDMTPHLPDRFAKLQRSQWFGPDRLRDIQRRKLRRLVSHAYDTVPYYRDLMTQAGIDPSHIAEPEDLLKLPITRKSRILTRDPDEFLAQGLDPAQCTDLMTSGSQGMPITVRFTHDDRSWWKLLALRGWLANGYRPWDRMLVLNDARFAPRGRRWYEYLGVFRQHYTSIYDEINLQATAAAGLNPHVIRGITSDVLRLGLALDKNGLTKLSPKLVLTSAELTDDLTRRTIEAIYGVPPTDFYGSIECGWIAWQCPEHTGYHINSDCLIVEFLNDGAPALPGQPGEIVVTNLHSHAMPFIRYSVGDIGVAATRSCSCGRGLPLMETMEGRLADSIILPGQRQISPYQLTCTVERFPGIARYQIYQAASGNIVVRIVPDRHHSPATNKNVEDALRSLLDNQLPVETEIVEDLTRGPGEKFRVVLSDFTGVETKIT